MAAIRLRLHIYRYAPRCLCSGRRRVTTRYKCIAGRSDRLVRISTIDEGSILFKIKKTKLLAPQDVRFQKFWLSTISVGYGG